MRIRHVVWARITCIVSVHCSGPITSSIAITFPPTQHTAYEIAPTRCRRNLNSFPKNEAHYTYVLSDHNSSDCPTTNAPTHTSSGCSSLMGLLDWGGCYCIVLISGYNRKARVAVEDAGVRWSGGFGTKNQCDSFRFSLRKILS